MIRKIIASFLIGLIILVGVSGAKAQTNEERIDKIIENVINNAKVPGVAVSVTNKDEVLFEKGYGVESLLTGKPMTENSLSAIGSVTKSFTTLAVLQQVEKGKINLDDPVIKYIPEFRTLDEERSGKITIRMLLTNTSGLHHNVSFDIFTRDSEIVNYIEAIKKNQTVELLFDPGTSYGYSNEGFVIAGHVLEIVTGMPYSRYMDEYVFGPLGMNKTTTDIERIKSEGALYGHQGGIDSFIPSKPRHLGLMIPAGSETRSTVHELTNYLRMLMNEGDYNGKSLLGKELFRETLAEPVVPFTMYGKEINYGYGWMHTDEYGLQFHGGQTLTMSSMLMWDKEKKIGVSVLYNVSQVKSGLDSSIMKIAADVLSVYTKKNYPGMGVEEEPLIRENQKPLDDEFFGQFISEDGYTRMLIENRGKPVARFIGTGGVSEYKLGQLSDTRIFAENINLEAVMEAKRGRNKEVISIFHPFMGRFVANKPLELKGYNDFSWNGFSFIYPSGMSIEESNNYCKIGMDDYALDIVELDANDNFFNTPGQKELIEETQVREVFMSGKKVSEKIQLYKEGGVIFANVSVRVEGEVVVGITGTIPFEELTTVRRRIIKPLIISLKHE